jgi:hypothetical protein
MALSGTFIGSTVGGGYRLEIDWSATQNISANQSTVTAKVYWHSLGSSYTVNSSATKTGSTTIDGTATSWSTAGASLSGNQRKLVATTSKTVTHDSTGNKSVAISSTYNVAVDLGGYVASVSASGTATLNQIPRETGLTSGQNWTAGTPITLSFDKKNSAYTTDVTIKVNAVTIKTIAGITGSSYSYTFTAGENQSIFVELAKDTTSWNQSSTIEVTTKSGSTTIGSMKSYTGTVSSPTATQVTAPDFTVGNSTTITLSSEQNASFVYDLTAVVGTYTKTIISKAGLSNPAWDTNADKTSILGQMPSNTATVTYTLTTYWANGTTYTKVRSADTDTAIATVNTTSEAPTFTGGVTYADTSTIATTTGNSAYIVQSKSTMTVTLASASLASAKTGTSMKEYQCTFNGKTVTVAHPATATNLTFVFNASDLNVSTNQNIVMKAVDNRTNSTSVSVSVSVVPYAPPVVTATASRDDGFSDPSTLTLSGSISPISTISTGATTATNKNSIKTMTYQYKVSTTSTYGQVNNFTAGTATFPAYKANNVALATQLTNTSAWDIQIIVTDQLGSTTVVKTVGIGQPIFFMDSSSKRVGVGMFPSGNGTLEISTGSGSTTGAYFKGSAVQGRIWTGSGGIVLQSDGTANLHLGSNNSTDMIFSNTDVTVGKLFKVNNTLDMLNHNIIGVNNILMNDVGGSEGVEWDSVSGLNNWKIVVTDDAGTGNVDTSAYPLQFFRNGVRMATMGTTGTVYATNGFVAQGGNINAGAGGMTGRLEHTDGYMTFGSYGGTTYGTGFGRVWYRSDANIYYFWNSANGLADIVCKSATSSLRELKTNIELDTESALDKIKSTPVYNFHYKTDLNIYEEDANRGESVLIGTKDPSTVKKNKGLIVDEAPQDIVIKTNDAIDNYAMASLMWKAIQELSGQVDSLSEKIKRR